MTLEQETEKVWQEITWMAYQKDWKIVWDHQIVADDRIVMKFETPDQEIMTFNITRN